MFDIFEEQQVKFLKSIYPFMDQINVNTRQFFLVIQKCFIGSVTILDTFSFYKSINNMIKFKDFLYKLAVYKSLSLDCLLLCLKCCSRCRVSCVLLKMSSRRSKGGTRLRLLRALIWFS